MAEAAVEDMDTTPPPCQPIGGTPVQILDFEFEEKDGKRVSTLVLKKHALDSVLKKAGEREIVFISIAGPSRRGKSFLLGFMLRFLNAGDDMDWIGWDDPKKPLTGFKWRNGYERETSGMWIWSEPFIVKKDDDKECAVLIMDTQGVFDEHTSHREWCTIVGLSLLTSSCLIFNMFNDIQEDSFQMLDNFIQYGLLAAETTDGQKPFQKLLFLLRDWNNPSEFPYGAKGGAEFIKKKLQDKPHLPADSRRVRQSIQDCFEQIECFLMPEPGEIAKKTNYDGSLEGLSKKFATNVEKCISNLLGQDELMVKTIGGIPIRANNLASLFEKYTEIFNSEETPSPIALLEATARFNNNNLSTKAKEMYKLEMQKKMRGNEFVKDSFLLKSHNDAMSKSVKFYESAKKIGDLAIANEFLVLLQQELAGALVKYQEANQHKKEQAIQRAVEDNATEYGRAVAAELEECFMDPEAFRKTSLREKDIFSNEFIETFESCEEEIVQKFLNSLLEKMEAIEASLKDRNDLLRSEAEKHNEKSVQTSIQSLRQKFDKLLHDGQYLDQLNFEDQLKTEKKEISDRFLKDKSRQGSRNFLKEFDSKLTKGLEEAQEFFVKENLRNKEQAELKMEKLLADCLEHFDNSMKTKFSTLGFQILEDLQGHFDIHEGESLALFNTASVTSNNQIHQQFMETLKGKIKLSKLEFEEQCFEKQRALKSAIEGAARGAVEDFEKTLMEHVNKFCPLLDFDEIILKSSASILSDYKEKTKGLEMENRDEEFEKLAQTFVQSSEALTEQLKIKIEHAELQSKTLVTECTNFHQKEMLPFVTEKLPRTEDELEEVHTKIQTAAKQMFIDKGGFSDADEFVRSFLEEIVAGTDEAYQQLRELFLLKKEESENFVKNALQDAKVYYHEEMEKHVQSASFLEPKVLESLNQTSTKNAIKRCGEKIKITPDQERELTQAMEVLYISYKNQNDMNTPTDPAIGIDLGTTYSCVAVYLNGKVHVIPNNEGKNTTPSYVSFNDTCELVGEPAKSKAHVDPENTIFDAKRLIGRKFDDEKVQSDMKLWPFKVVEEGGVPKVEARGKTYHPEQIAAYILTEMKQVAEKFLKVPVKNAVITVPAYFTDGQKQATIDAGKIAGLNVLQIISEPTSAAIAYRLSCKTDETSRNVLIFDLGGGTFDVAVLTIKAGEIDVKSKDGDTHLGGEDFDNNIVDYCVEQHLAATGINLLEGRNSANATERHKTMKTLRRLRNVCEQRKCDLSSGKKVDICVDAIDGSTDLNVSLTRDKFEELNQYLFDDALQIVDKVITDANMSKKDIDDIVLVGGSTRIPKVQQMLTEYFEGKALDQTVNQDEAVAYGAAVQAACLNGDIAQKSGDYTKLSDVTPRSLGVEVYGGDFSIIMPKSTKIPKLLKEVYRTAHNNQTSVEIVVYEGEDSVAAKNHLLGKFYLNGIPPADAEKEEIRVEMNINDQGILHVTALCVSNGQATDLAITEHKLRLTKEAINKMLTDGQARSV